MNSISNDTAAALLKKMTGPGISRPEKRRLEAIPVVVEGPTGAMCAATMCPLFAPDGSPWTGQYRSACEGEACGFYDKQGSRCEGGVYAVDQVMESAVSGHAPLQLDTVIHGAAVPGYFDRNARTFDCPYADICQWQKDVPEGSLCPPRHALSIGVDPRACAY